MAFLKNTKKVSIPVNMLTVRIGTKGLLSEEEDVKELKDLRSFEFTVEYGTEDYHTFESGEYQYSDVITKAVGCSWTQNRIKGDEVSDYIESTVFGGLEDAYTALEVVLVGGYGMRGAFLIKPGAIGGDAQNLLTQPVEAALSGKPEIITPETTTE